MEHGAWGFFLVCAPVVCVGAPLGSAVSSRAHRLVLAAAVYALDGVQLVRSDSLTSTPILWYCEAKSFVGAGTARVKSHRTLIVAQPFRSPTLIANPTWDR